MAAAGARDVAAGTELLRGAGAEPAVGVGGSPRAAEVVAKHAAEAPAVGEAAIGHRGFRQTGCVVAFAPRTHLDNREPSASASRLGSHLCRRRANLLRGRR